MAGGGDDLTGADDATEETGEPRRDDGLDLARSLTRSTASSGSSAPARRRRRSRPAGETGTARRGRLSGAHPDERDPQLLDGEVARLVEERGWELPLRMRSVFARWPELVGEEVASHCTPESFSDGALVVRTDSTAWATQLRLLGNSVLRRLNEDLGAGTVTSLDVQGPRGPTWKKGLRSVRDGRGPRDTYG